MPGCISSIECLSANAGRRQTKTLAEVVLRSRLAERKEEAAVSGKEAKTMTVRAMGALLGLKKTEILYERKGSCLFTGGLREGNA